MMQMSCKDTKAKINLKLVCNLLLVSFSVNYFVLFDKNFVKQTLHNQTYGSVV